MGWVSIVIVWKGWKTKSLPSSPDRRVGFDPCRGWRLIEGPLEHEGQPDWLCQDRQLGSVSKRPFLSWRKPKEMAWNHFISWLAVQEYRHQLNIWHTLQNKDKIRVHSSCQPGDYASTPSPQWMVPLYLDSNLTFILGDLSTWYQGWVSLN